MPADVTAPERPYNETAPIVTRVMLERLTDELEQLDLQLWLEPDTDRREVRERVGRATLLAFALLDLLPPG
jgi:hypothetical protein